MPINDYRNLLPAYVRQPSLGASQGFGAVKPVHSDWADEFASTIGHAIGKGLSYDKNADPAYWLSKERQDKLANERDAAAARDAAVGELSPAAGPDGVTPGYDGKTLLQGWARARARLAKGGVKTDELDAAAQAVALANNDNDTAAAINIGISHSPLGKDSSFTVSRQDQLRENDFANELTKQHDTQDFQRKQTEFTEGQQNKRSANSIAAEDARAKENRDAENERAKKTLSVDSIPSLESEFDVQRGATYDPSSKSFTGGSEADPDTRTAVISRAADLIKSGKNPVEAIRQAKSDLTKPSDATAGGWFGIGSKPAGARLELRDKPRIYNKDTGRLEPAGG